MVSDSVILTRLREILHQADLDTTTVGSVRRQLEKEFGVDLSARRDFIREQVILFLKSFYGKKKEKVREYDEDGDADVCRTNKLEIKDKNETSSREKKVEKEVKHRGGDCHKLCSLSPQLQKFAGVSELSRTEVEKKVWAHIQENSLQDPENKQNILCDDSLRAFFGVNYINVFQMNKALSKHIWPLSAEENAKHKVKDEDGNDLVTADIEQEEDGHHDRGDEEDGHHDHGDEEEEEQNNLEPQGSNKEWSSEVGKVVKKKGGFAKLYRLTPRLQEFTGEPELTRREVVRRLWTYIQEKNLRNPKNKKIIKCDKPLQALFNTKSIKTSRMVKVLLRHLWPLSEDVPKQKGKRQKKGGSDSFAPLQLSDALVNFFGTGKTASCRAEVVKRMWEYIKQNDLQDPADRRIIICDDKLRELFKGE